MTKAEFLEKLVCTKKGFFSVWTGCWVVFFFSIEQEWETSKNCCSLEACEWSSRFMSRKGYLLVRNKVPKDFSNYSILQKRQNFPLWTADVCVEAPILCCQLLRAFNSAKVRGTSWHGFHQLRLDFHFMHQLKITYLIIKSPDLWYVIHIFLQTHY